LQTYGNAASPHTNATVGLAPASQIGPGPSIASGRRRFATAATAPSGYWWSRPSSTADHRVPDGDKIAIRTGNKVSNLILRPAPSSQSGAPLWASSPSSPASCGGVRRWASRGPGSPSAGPLRQAGTGPDGSARARHGQGGSSMWSVP